MSRAVQIDQPGGPEQLKIVQVEVGEPGPGQVRIRHKAVGLNFIDVYHRTGLYPMPMPARLGMEGAGVIEAVGEGVTHLKVGDRAPDFELTDTEGQTVRLADFRGKKNVVLAFYVLAFTGG